MTWTDVGLTIGLQGLVALVCIVGGLLWVRHIASK